MWLFTKYGFFSVVCARDLSRKKAKHLQVLDKNLVMIRSRRFEHLCQLIKRFMSILDDYEIQNTEDTDYPYRLIIPRKLWVKVATELANEIDYGNFKDAAENNNAGFNYCTALHEIWGLMLATQFKPKP